jgi:hypothetical protein
MANFSVYVEVLAYFVTNIKLIIHGGEDMKLTLIFK